MTASITYGDSLHYLRDSLAEHLRRCRVQARRVEQHAPQPLECGGVSRLGVVHRGVGDSEEHRGRVCPDL